jgi:hypothetical protein
MELRADAKLPFPRELVFTTYRDKMPELVRYLPNVLGITVTSRADAGAVTRLVNLWKGGGEIPASARTFVDESMLSWDDHATWNAADFTCEWRIVTRAFTEAVSCTGKTRFTDDGKGGTAVEIRGQLSIDASKVKGVPRLLAGTVSRAVEGFLAQRIGPNLVDVSNGVGKYLAEQQAKKA